MKGHHLKRRDVFDSNSDLHWQDSKGIPNEEKMDNEVVFENGAMISERLPRKPFTTGE